MHFVCFFFAICSIWQWLGESDLRFKMQGRLILVSLLCRDMAAPQSIETIIGIDNDITGKLVLFCVSVTIFGMFSRCKFFFWWVSSDRLSMSWSYDECYHTHIHNAASVQFLFFSSYLVFLLCTFPVCINYGFTIFKQKHQIYDSPSVSTCVINN